MMLGYAKQIVCACYLIVTRGNTYPFPFLSQKEHTVINKHNERVHNWNKLYWLRRQMNLKRNLMVTKCDD